jgi:hypothetical protein
MLNDEKNIWETIAQKCLTYAQKLNICSTIAQIMLKNSLREMSSLQ